MGRARLRVQQAAMIGRRDRRKELKRTAKARERERVAFVAIDWYFYKQRFSPAPRAGLLQTSLSDASNASNWAALTTAEIRALDAKANAYLVSRGQSITARDVHNYATGSSFYMQQATNRLSAQDKRERKAMIDEYGDLVKRLAPVKPDMSRLTTLTAAIRSWYEDADATASVSAFGERYVVSLGPRGNQTKIENMQDVFAALGRERFLSVCSLSLANLAAALDNPDAYTVSEQTGPRPLTVQDTGGG
jgi:hypothetical protein